MKPKPARKAASLSSRGMPGTQVLARSILERANRLKDQGRLARAESLYRQSLQVAEKLLGPKHHELAQSMNSLANLLHDQGRYAEAELLYRESLELRKRALG